MRRSCALLLIIFAAVSAQPGALTAQPESATSSLVLTVEPDLNGLDAFITSVMKEWKVPGLAIAVVEDGEITLSKGYGYRNVDAKLPVTPQTLFAIGSISKSFTVTVLGTLVDDGLIDWDEPVRTYLPDFRLYDEVATGHMTPRDLVTHRSGLPRHDRLWYGSSFTRKEMYDRLRYLEPSKDFRAVFQYQNLMFMTAGYLAGQVAGMKWEELVRARIFQPLRMQNSNFSVLTSEKSNDFALPYRKVDDDLSQVPFRNIDEIGPAGSINSNVEEMIRYVQLHINKGEYGDTRVLSEKNAEDMQTPQMVTPGTIRFEELGHSAYGLGLGVTTYRGHKVVRHGGGIDGFISLLSFMPGKKIGMIILTNMSGNNPVPTIVSRNVYDRLLGLEQVDWVGRIKEQQAKAEEAEKEAEQKDYTYRVEGTAPSHDLADYVGSYEHPGYGVLKIEMKGKQLQMKINSFTSPLEHFHYDIFEVPENSWDPLEGTKVTFLYNKKGGIDRATVPFESNVSDIVFTRVADEEMRQRAFLEPFIGEYELGARVVTVALKGDDTLTLTLPGQPIYELVPTRGTSFDLKGLNGFSVEFKKNKSGPIPEMVIHQPNGTFVATRK